MAKKTTTVAKTAALADTAAAATTPQVGVAAEFLVGSITIPISAADLANIKANGLQFALPPGDKVNVGSISDFISNLGKLLGVTLTLPTKEQLGKLPFAKLLDEPLIVTRLSLNTKSRDFSIAIGFYPENPIAIIDTPPLNAIKMVSLAFSVDIVGETTP